MANGIYKITEDFEKALSDYMVANTKKLSFWNKLQICWGILV
jgi:hypothetical protein